MIYDYIPFLNLRGNITQLYMIAGKEHCDVK